MRVASKRLFERRRRLRECLFARIATNIKGLALVLSRARYIYYIPQTMQGCGRDLRSSRALPFAYYIIYPPLLSKNMYGFCNQPLFIKSIFRVLCSFIFIPLITIKPRLRNLCLPYSVITKIPPPSLSLPHARSRPAPIKHTTSRCCL